METFTVIYVFVAICVGIITYFKHKHKYWARKGLPYIEPTIPYGTSQNPIRPKRASFEILHEQYNRLRKLGHKHAGLYLFATPVYTPLDPDLLRHILAKDFLYFQNRGAFYDEKNDPLSAHLFSLEGAKWRNMRFKLTPTFSSGKMKLMFQTLMDCGDQMMELIKRMSERNECIDSKDILACFTTDVIGSCAFGLDCNSIKDPKSEFREAGRMLFTQNWRRMFRVFMILVCPRLCKKIGIPIFERRLTNFFMNVVKNVIKYRDDNNVIRNDFMQILLELKNNAEGLTVNEMAAQAFVFFLAGFETSSTLMNYCLFELALNQDIQDKLRGDIVETLEKYDGRITYESLAEMKYIGQVIDESLRKYPPVPTLLRQCCKDYRIPGSDVVVEKGTRVVISVKGLHHDAEYYPDPEKFDPERFSEENKAKRHPFVYLPFGEGPRNCIGIRFGMMQARVGLSLILKDYRVKLNPKTILPLGQDPGSFLMLPKNILYLDVEKV